MSCFCVLNVSLSVWIWSAIAVPDLRVVVHYCMKWTRACAAACMCTHHGIGDKASWKCRALFAAEASASKHVWSESTSSISSENTPAIRYAFKHCAKVRGHD